jgi:uncharacterized repeat protein (TIGR01451 family)
VECTVTEGQPRAVANQVLVPPLETGSCTITNEDLPAHLTLVKVVKGEGAAAPTEWTLSADGPTPISGATGSDAVTGAPVDAGTYELSEVGPHGYKASDWVCEGGTQEGASITVPLGGAATCTITNTLPGTFDVAKSSDPPSGSTVEPGDVITYTITARKLAGIDPTGVIVTDDLSGVLDNATLVPDSVEVSTGTASIADTTLTWSIPVLSGTETVSYKVKVNADAWGVRLRNAVTSPGSETCPPADTGQLRSAVARRAAAQATIRALAADDDACSTTHVTPEWLLVKTSNPKSGSTVDPGSTITYKLTVTNVSEAVVSNAVVRDDLSDVLAHGTLVAVPDNATLQGTTLIWDVPSLDPGAKSTLTYQVKLDADAFNVTVTNVATPGSGGDCDTTCSTHHTTPQPAVSPAQEPPLAATGIPTFTLLAGALLMLVCGFGCLLLTRRRT